MAQETNDILDRIHKAGIKKPSSGLIVPEGFFDNFRQDLLSALPERPEIERDSSELAVERTLWQKIRPYVYMAAMFAGIWLMLQMFASVSGSHRLKPIADNPVLARAMQSDDFVFDYVYPDMSSEDFVDEVLEPETLETIDIDALFNDDSIAESQSDYLLPQ